MKYANQQAITIILAGLIIGIGQFFALPQISWAQSPQEVKESTASAIPQPNILETPLHPVPAGNPFDLTPDYEQEQPSALPTPSKIDTTPPKEETSPLLVPIPVTTKIKINLATKTLSLLKNDQVYKSFPVGIGRPGFPTPQGHFSVIRKTKNPVWENPYKPAKAMVIKAGAGNPLGTRWIGFLRNASGEYGIHGTDRPASVGKASSHGCVRMRIPDAEFVFDQVSLGTDVIIVNEAITIVGNAPKAAIKAPVITKATANQKPSANAKTLPVKKTPVPTTKKK